MARKRNEKNEQPTKCMTFKSRFRRAFIDDTIVGGNPIVQQTMPGWFSYVSLRYIFPFYFILAAFFIVLGGFMLWKNVHHSKMTIRVSYSAINKYQYVPENPEQAGKRIRSFTVNGVEHKQGVTTYVHFTVKRRLAAPVYLYYALDNVYQNFRTFNDGRSTSQLTGAAEAKWRPKLDSCLPFARPGYLDNSGDEMLTVKDSGSGDETQVAANEFVYNPCGSMPWSMFNDTFVLYKMEEGLQLICNTSDFDATGNPLGGTKENRCVKKGISFEADTSVRFGPLQTGSRVWSINYPLETTSEYLRRGWYMHEPGHSLPNPEDLDLQVWMRTALLSHFRKLLRIIEVDLEPGEYVMQIDEFYDVVAFNGKKGFVLMSGGPMGNGTRPIAILFFVMGMVSFIIGVAFGMEACCRRAELFPNMSDPKRRWYVFDPTAPEFELYNALRIKRFVPVVELQALREQQTAK